MSEYIARFTRAVHKFAVRLHVAGLRTVVSQADRKAASASENRRIAKAAVAAATNAFSKAAITERGALIAQTTVRQAAREEAEQIGGTL